MIEEKDMKMNRAILRKHIDNEVIVTRIMNKAQNSIDIKTVCKMGKSVTEATCSFVHFNIDNWIEAQEKHLKSPTIRKDTAKRVKSTMNIVKRVRDKIRKETGE